MCVDDCCGLIVNLKKYGNAKNRLLEIYINDVSAICFILDSFSYFNKESEKTAWKMKFEYVNKKKKEFRGRSKIYFGTNLVFSESN